MSVTIDAATARLAALPITPDRWQLDVRRFPGWVQTGDEAPPIRPVLVMVLSEDEDLLGGSPPVPREQLQLSHLLEALLGLAAEPRIGYLPTVLEVAAPEWVEPLTQTLRGRGVQVRTCDAAPLVDAAYASLRSRVEDPIASLSLVMATDSSPALLKSLDTACHAFVVAQGWREMNDTDLLEVVSECPAEMGWVSVMGGAVSLGLGFFASFEDYDRLMRTKNESRFRARGAMWSLMMEPECEIPVADSDVLGSGQADRLFPSMLRVSPSGSESGAAGEHIAHAESLLHMIAQVTPDDIDRGTWTCTVPCANGTRTVTLRLASLLDLDELERVTLAGRTPEQRVQLMLGLAGEMTGANRARLARKVLRESPDEPGAWMLLAEDVNDPGQAERLWTEAAAAAARRMGAEGMEEHGDRLGEQQAGLIYLEARFALANLWWDSDRQEESLSERIRLLASDLGDPLDICNQLIPDLLFAGRDEAAEHWMRRLAFEPDAEQQFAEALLLFRRDGDGEPARTAWAKACKLNMHVPRYLADLDAIPDRLPEAWVQGSDDHAQNIASDLSDAWDKSPGAVEWVRTLRRERKQARKSGARKR